MTSAKTTPTLQELLTTQKDLELHYGVDLDNLDEVERLQLIKDMVVALEDELHEFLNELHWKPWDILTPPGGPLLKGTMASAQGELVDVFHFFLTLCLAMDMTAEDITIRYLAKVRRNKNRQATGLYTASHGKCVFCGVAKDDVIAYDNTLCEASPTKIHQFS